MPCSGGAYAAADFSEGWGLKIFRSAVAHYWRRLDAGDIKGAFSSCGDSTILEYEIRAGHIHPALYEPGDYPHCKKCERRQAIAAPNTQSSNPQP